MNIFLGLVLFLTGVYLYRRGTIYDRKYGRKKK